MSRQAPKRIALIIFRVRNKNRNVNIAVFREFTQHYFVTYAGNWFIQTICFDVLRK